MHVQPCARGELVNLRSQCCSSTGMSQLPDRQLFTTPACSGTIFEGEQTFISDCCVGPAWNCSKGIHSWNFPLFVCLLFYNTLLSLNPIWFLAPASCVLPMKTYNLAVGKKDCGWIFVVFDQRKQQ